MYQNSPNFLQKNTRTKVILIIIFKGLFSALFMFIFSHVSFFPFQETPDCVFGKTCLPIQLVSYDGLLPPLFFVNTEELAQKRTKYHECFDSIKGKHFIVYFHSPLLSTAGVCEWGDMDVLL